MREHPLVYIVATPIGNLDDLSPRARRILSEVDIIAAEDTRHTAKLLTLLGIHGKELISYHDHIEEQRAEQLIARAERDKLHIAVVSDAGTPCIADPGYRIVAKARQHGIAVSPIPGPSALTALAASAGLPTDRLLFIGFLPSRTKALQDEVARWRASAASIICYESARRLPKTLAIIAELLPEADVAIAREMTKLYEEIHLLAIAKAVTWAQNHKTLKGEVALMIAPGQPVVDMAAVATGLRGEARAALAAGASHKDLMIRFADRGLERKALYQLLLELRDLANTDDQ